MQVSHVQGFLRCSLHPGVGSIIKQNNLLFALWKALIPDIAHVLRRFNFKKLLSCHLCRAPLSLGYRAEQLWLGLRVPGSGNANPDLRDMIEYN